MGDGKLDVLAEDKDYGDKPSYGAAFDIANRLFTVAYDGQIRRYDRDGHLKPGGYARRQRALSIAVHPDRGKARHRLQRYHDGRSLRCAALNRLYAAETIGINGNPQQRRLVCRWFATLCR